MKSSSENSVFKIRPDRFANPLMRVGVGLTRGLIEHTLCFPELNRIYADTVASGQDQSLSFARRALLSMNVTWQIHAPGEQPIRRQRHVAHKWLAPRSLAELPTSRAQRRLFALLKAK